MAIRWESEPEINRNLERRWKCPQGSRKWRWYHTFISSSSLWLSDERCWWPKIFEGNERKPGYPNSTLKTSTLLMTNPILWKKQQNRNFRAPTRVDGWFWRQMSSFHCINGVSGWIVCSFFPAKHLDSYSTTTKWMEKRTVQPFITNKECTTFEVMRFANPAPWRAPIHGIPMPNGVSSRLNEHWIRGSNSFSGNGFILSPRRRRRHRSVLLVSRVRTWVSHDGNKLVFLPPLDKILTLFWQFVDIFPNQKIKWVFSSVKIYSIVKMRFLTKKYFTSS